MPGLLLGPSPGFPIAGLLPLAFGFGAGSELQRPLAIAVIGGLLVSTFFTLIVIPLGCSVLARGHLVPDEDHLVPDADHLAAEEHQVVPDAGHVA